MSQNFTVNVAGLSSRLHNTQTFPLASLSWSVLSSGGHFASASRETSNNAFSRSSESRSDGISTGGLICSNPVIVASGGGESDRDQSLIRGNVSTGVQLVCVSPRATHGVFSMGADGKIRLHLTAPLSDIPAGGINVRCDTEAHGCAPGGEDWMAKLLNVAAILGAVQLFVTLDAYRAEGRA